MSKGILVMDMPESCAKCKLFFDSYTDMICRGNHRTINYPYPDKKVQDWCPLREVPDKKEYGNLKDTSSLKWCGMDWELITHLMNCFPNSFINHNGEFIAEKKSNTYFNLKDCRNPLDVKCKVLEWISRSAHKGHPYKSEKRNKEFRKFMLNGINQFLGTSFLEDDMEQIYTYLGNAINHERTVAFVESGYDMNLFINKNTTL